MIYNVTLSPVTVTCNSIFYLRNSARKTNPMQIATHRMPGMVLKSHAFQLPLDYAHPDGAQLTADVRFEPLPGDASGAAIRSASLAYTSPEGETAIVPAVGLVTCPTTG